MPSVALTRWRGERAAVLNELEQAHHAVGGRGRGRRTQTQSINEALLLRLAAEFQGFCRDLHAEGVEAFRVRLATTHPAVSVAVSATLGRTLRLDHGNPGPKELRRDFSRFGVELFDELTAANSRSAVRLVALKDLMEMRNAIAHADTQGLAALAQRGIRLNLNTFRNTRSKLSVLAGTLDMVIGRHIGQLFSEPPVW